MEKANAELKHLGISNLLSFREVDPKAKLRFTAVLPPVVFFCPGGGTGIYPNEFNM